MIKLKNLKIIAIEGLDKSGKHTLTMALFRYLQAQGYKVAKSSFHRYDTPTGHLIQQYLYKHYDVDKLTIELIMSADKQAQQDWFVELDNNGTDFLILDRYIGSQVCYSTSTGIDKEWVELLQSKLIKPDLEYLIDVEPEVSMSRKGKHGENDRYESDFNFLTSVRSAYHSYFSESDSRVIIDATNNETADNVLVKVQNDISQRLPEIVGVV